ncbi:MAG: YIP1 family protein [Pararhodobacter sp.]|nr:YIP1 family protein [Pararhodobacter sp.]
MSLTGDILRSWRAPRAVLRRRLATAEGERSAIFYLLLACVLIFVAQWPRLAMQAAVDDSIPFQGLMAGALFGWLFLAPLLFYAISGIIGLVMRLIRPGTPWLAVRLALFWALLAISPLVLLQGAVAPMAGAQSPLALVSGLAVLAGFVALLGAGLRVALEAAQAAA